MKRRSYPFIIFIFFILFHSSYLFAEKKLFCQEVFLDPISVIKNHIQQRVQELGGEKNFAERYTSIQGLLTLARELSEVTNDLDPIFQAFLDSNILEENTFTGLEWPPSFNRSFIGSRKMFEALINGFFNREGGFRKKDNRILFFFSEGESFPVSGEEGFDRFVKRVFSGDEDRAFFAVISVLNSDQIQEIEWKGVFHLRDGKLIKRTKNQSKKIGDLKNKIGDMIENLISDDTLINFFKEKGINILSELLRNETYGFPFSSLTSEQQKDQSYKPHQREVEREIDVVMESVELDGPIVFVEIKFKLTLEHVHKFLKTLAVRKLILPKFSHRPLIAVLAFYKFSNDEVLVEANKAGLYMIRISGVYTEQMNPKGFEPNFF